MFTPKKTIPKLAVAMLALTGCGGDGNNTGGQGGGGATGGSGGSGAAGGTGGTGGSGNGPSGALEAFCVKKVDCFSEMYPDYTVEDCLALQDSYLGDIDDRNCLAANVSYFNCAEALSCPELIADSNSCDDELDAVFDVCGL